MRSLSSGSSLLLIAATLAGAGFSFAAPALAQETASASTSGLEDIVVTARRKEESLQSVPISVQAFSGETLSERNVQDANDLQKVVPSLTTYQQARDEVTVSIRGQSSSGASAQGQNPRVTAYFAQVPLQTGDNGPGRFFDLSNVQVLKGPQGTLFGRNSTGGAMLYEPARPTQDLGGYVTLQLGQFHDRQIEGALNLPITDILSVRIAGKRAKRDGFTKNIVTGEELDDRNYVAGRVSVLFTPSDSFENYTMFDYLKSDTNGSSQQILGIDTNKIFQANVAGTGLPLALGGGGPSPTLLGTNYALAVQLATAAGRFSLFPDPLLPNQLANQNNLGPRISQSAVDGLSRARSWGVTNVTTFNLSDDLTLKNIFGYRRYKQLSRYDFDGTVFPLLDQITPNGWSANIRQITDEIQLQGKALDGKLDFTVGGFFLWGKSPKPQTVTQVSVGVPSVNTSDPVERSQAVFGQATYDLSDMVTEGFSITAGYRYTHDFRSLTASNVRAGVCSLLFGCPNFQKVAFNASSYNIGLDYQITPQTLLYVTHRRGYRAGGLNPQAGNSGFQYDPETVTDFEAGLKTDFTLGGMEGRANFAAYMSKLKDAQVSLSFSETNPVTNATALINVISNAANAKIKGLETDITLVPFENFNISASYAYTDAKYTKFFDPNNNNAPITGRPFPFQAKHRLNIGGNYTIPLSEHWGEVTASANWSYSSSYQLSVFPDPLGVENGYNQLDLRLDWKNFGDRDVTLGLFVNNVTKELYKIGGVPIYSVLGTTSALYNEPRTWGLQLRYRFGE
ncbi:TonB-dependent receptor [Sphingomonas sp. KC8]|nr:TonB-dependent receptor [Sphingomonas sp. KC8]